MSAKDDMFKRISAAVKRKKYLSKEISRDKTIVHWVSEFFSEVQNTKRMDEYGSFTHLALSKLTVHLRTVDKKVAAVYKEPADGSEPKVEIYWSEVYATQNNCEHITTLDAPSAYFQDAMDRQE